jgi:WD40 repeat protein
MGNISRRDLLSYCASVWVASHIGIEAAQIGNSRLKITLMHEFAQSTAKSLSSDGTRLCIEDWAAGGYPLRVVEMGTWRIIYSGRFRSRVLTTSFFLDGQELFLEGPGAAGEKAYWQANVELSTGKCFEQKRQLDNDSRMGDHVLAAIGDHRLLITQLRRSPNPTEAVEIVEFPNFREILKVPYATQPREPIRRSGDFELSNDMGIGLSADRKILVYSFDHVLVCRRVSDLKVLWTRQLNLFAPKVVVSNSGSHVAVALTDFENKYGIALYNGKTGAEVTLLPDKGINGIDLSPDGKLVAVVDRSIGKDHIAVPKINIYDVASGQKMATVTHDQIKNSRQQFLKTSCTVWFSSDGKYMITSGMNTKIWSIEER